MHIYTIFLLLATSAHVSPQTLYGVSESVVPSGVFTIVPESVSISAAGVGADGGTTYVEIEVESSHVVSQLQPSKTITLISAPTTFTQTFVADASGFRYSYPPSVIFGSSVTLAETCSFGANGIGTCVEQYFTGPPTTFSGSVVPFYTLAAATPAPTTAPNGATPHHVFARWSVVWMVLGILFHNL